MKQWVRAGPLWATAFWILSLGICPACSCGSTTSVDLEVVILVPVDGAEFDQGDSIVFQGQARDAIGTLSGDMLDWSSSLNGELGSGETLTRNDLSVGQHTISLLAQNETGQTDSDSVTITINPRTQNLPPVAEILAPGEGFQFDQGSQVNLNGQATDPEEGVLSSSALTWTSNVNGMLGNGQQLTVSNLTLGEHLLTLTALDGQGLAGRA
ncbi:MAG: hypothetical protein JRJ19_00645, partial [Deltaproteobacteria bacterium]|nr:hypothetical protein [Deltaproteobacteria bacterium]